MEDKASLSASDIARLEAWLSRSVEGFRGPLEVSRFSGGQSNPTFRLDGPEASYVLRRKPRGETLTGAHAVDREFRVLKALQGSDVPVPEVLGFCDDGSVIGGMFYVMSFVEGRVFWDPTLPEMTTDERSALFASMNRTIASIHTVDPQACGLTGFGREGDYVQRQISRWSRQHAMSETRPNPAMHELSHWLEANRPPGGATVLVHGDYRLDNLLVHPTEPRVVAVLDWELSTLGDPTADFAYHVMSWRIDRDLFRGLAGVDHRASGIPSEESYVHAYFQASHSPPPANWDFYIVLSLFRLAAILQGIAKRAELGNAANADAAEVGAKAFPISDIALDLARKISS